MLGGKKIGLKQGFGADDKQFTDFKDAVEKGE